jgi:phosphoribosylglycinamide formyltransferase-1
MREDRLADRLKIAVFASGRGSNFESILNSIESGKIKNTEIVCVLSNKSDAGALEFAKRKNIPAVHISRQQYLTNDDFASSLIKRMDEFEVNFIVLAGYMKILSPVIVRKFKNRIINIHPALLPRFGGKGMYGIHVHEAVLKSGENISGASVHIVDEEYDHGPILMQETVNIDENETVETLAAKVLKVEHKIYPEVVRLFSESKIKIEDGKVVIDK